MTKGFFIWPLICLFFWLPMLVSSIFSKSCRHFSIGHCLSFRHFSFGHCLSFHHFSFGHCLSLRT
jgi:hypothetical protein